MKTILRLLSIFILVTTINACQNEGEELITNETTSTSKQVESGIFNRDICDFNIVTANDSYAVNIGETKTFTVSNNVPTSTRFKWSVIRGAGIQVIGSSTSRSFTVKFNLGFNGGSIRLETNYSGNCNKEFDVSLVSCSKITTPPSQTPILSDFLQPYPQGYVPNNLGNNYICTKTVANILYVPLERCVNYSWSISPGGFDANIQPSFNGSEALVNINKPGTYVVTLRRSNSAGSNIEKYTLYAQDCNTGGGGGGFGF
ncbi:hypothetical protein [uncultured Tenacibaculum sp.]|uniref:hypothetical protein n=1 Tax=uncultured Tenacibaculum sp. TaxID=174713 RepID=UPI00261C5466|nr:hypothetical protein [uncultured Tenacibaculum sp.]